MKKHSIKLQNIIEFDCDSKISEGIEELLKACDEKPSISLTSKPSIFNLIKQYLDKPFEEFLNLYFTEESHNIFKGKKFSNFGQIDQHGLQIRREDFQEIINSLEFWRDRIYTFREHQGWYVPIDQQFTFKATLGTFEEFLLYLARNFLPKTTNDPISASNENSKQRTQKINGNSIEMCQLCWRDTMRHEIEKSEGHTRRSIRKLNGSSKYCKYHSPSINKSNYIRDKAYIHAFEHEKRAAYPFKYESNFKPGIEWYLEQRGSTLNDKEIAFVAYHLVRSKLGSDRRKQIIELRDENKTTSEIADIVDITRQATLKNLNHINFIQKQIIEQKIRD